VDALERGDPADMAEELGDVLLQVYLNAQIAEEAGAFVLEDVYEALASKLVRRHPHVFGTVAAETAADVAVNWARIKAAERRSAGARADQAGKQRVPVGLPALARAQALLHRRHAAAGKPSQPGTPITETELAAALAALVARAEDAGIDAEEALRRWTRRFERMADGTPGI
jgi:NTP pyrophosphatase (non-canonical NTP hydrolase)